MCIEYSLLNLIKFEPLKLLFLKKQNLNEPTSDVFDVRRCVVGGVDAQRATLALGQQVLEVVGARELLVCAQLGLGQFDARLPVRSVRLEALGVRVARLRVVAHQIGGARHPVVRLLVAGLELARSSRVLESRLQVTECQVGSCSVHQCLADNAAVAVVLCVESECVVADCGVVVPGDEALVALAIERVEAGVRHGEFRLVEWVRRVVVDEDEVGRRVDEYVHLGKVALDGQRGLFDEQHAVGRYEGARRRLVAVRLRRTVVRRDDLDVAELVLDNQDQGGHRHGLGQRATQQVAALVTLVHQHVAQVDERERRQRFRAHHLVESKRAELQLSLSTGSGGFLCLRLRLSERHKAAHFQLTALRRTWIWRQCATVALDLFRLLQHLVGENFFGAAHFTSLYGLNLFWLSD